MIKTIFLMLFISWAGLCIGQETVSDRISIKIARKLKDSLELTSGQEMQLIGVNQYLANQKMALRSRLTSLDSLRIETQKIEGMRDSIYNNILGNKYILYRQKKHLLVNNN